GGGRDGLGEVLHHGVDERFARAEVVDDRVRARAEHAAEAADGDVLELGVLEVLGHLRDDRGLQGGVGLPGHGVSSGSWAVRDRSHTINEYIT
ncbi:hypothetical protein CN290_31940, partial [Bacillus cereus]